MPVVCSGAAASLLAEAFRARRKVSPPVPASAKRISGYELDNYPQSIGNERDATEFAVKYVYRTGAARKLAARYCRFAW